MKTSVWRIWRIWLWATLLLVLAAAFVGYLQPGLLADFVNLRYCS